MRYALFPERNADYQGITISEKKIIFRPTNAGAGDI
jgi:hypothetical protein